MRTEELVKCTVLGKKDGTVDLLRPSIEQERLFSDWYITFDQNFEENPVINSTRFFHIR